MTNENTDNTGNLFILLVFITGWRGVTDEEVLLGNIVLPFTEI